MCASLVCIMCVHFAHGQTTHTAARCARRRWQRTPAADTLAHGLVEAMAPLLDVVADKLGQRLHTEQPLQPLQSLFEDGVRPLVQQLVQACAKRGAAVGRRPAPQCGQTCRSARCLLPTRPKIRAAMCTPAPPPPCPRPRPPGAATAHCAGARPPARGSRSRHASTHRHNHGQRPCRQCQGRGSGL